MNDSQTTSSIQPANEQERVKSKMRKPSLPLEEDIYQQVNSKLRELSMQIGYTVPLSKFLRRTFLENWEAELERYRKGTPAKKISSN